MLDIKYKADWDLLKPLLERLDVRYERVLTEEEKQEHERNWEILMKGVKFDDFDKFMEDFEEYRKDSPTNRDEILEKEQIEKDWEIIRQGIDVDDPEQFMKDFEESRKDRKLPFRD